MNAKVKFASAHHPRETEWSTIAPSDRLQCAYKVYCQAAATAATIIPLNIVLLHDIGLAKESWDPYVQKLVERFSHPLRKVVAVDCVTQGDSFRANYKKLGTVATCRDYAKDAIRICRIERLAGVVILAGHGRGALAAFHAANLEPLMFDSVIAIEPFSTVDRLISMSLEQNSVCTAMVDSCEEMLPILQGLICEVLYIGPGCVKALAALMGVETWVDIPGINLLFTEKEWVDWAMTRFIKRRFVRGARLVQESQARSLLTDQERQDYVHELGRKCRKYSKI